MAVKLDDRSRGRTPGVFAPGAAASQRDERFAPRPGDTLPPTPVAALLAAGGADLILLSTDAQLIDTVTRASRDQLPVWSVGSWVELETAVSVARRAVVLIDAELLGNTTAARIAALDAYSHKVVTLVAADRSAAQGLMGLLSERKVHRLLIKPPALGITRLLVDSAVGRCLRLADERAPEVAAPVEESRAPVRRARAATPLWVLAAAAAALLAGVAVIASVPAWWRSSSQDVASPVQVPAEATAIVAMEVAPRAVPEVGDAVPVDAVVMASYAEAETALLANDYAGAARALANVRRVDATSSRLAFLEAQLERAREQVSARDLVEEQRQSATATNTELASLVTIARARIQRGDLLDPSGDSASEYVNRAERLAPQHADVIAIRDELAAELLTGARSALAGGDVARAGALARRASALGADAGEVARLDAEVARRRAERAAEQRAEWLALAEARLREGALVEPVDDSAHYYLSTLQSEAPQHAGLAAAWAVFSKEMQDRIAGALADRDWTKAEEGLAALANTPDGAAAGEPLQARLRIARLEERYLAVAAPANELELLERVAPDYPVEAARNGIEGWVEVEFIVDVTGQPRDFAVVAAEPEGEFEAAALAALAKYRYRPFVDEGRPFARRLGLRMRFNLE